MHALGLGSVRQEGWAQILAQIHLQRRQGVAWSRHDGRQANLHGFNGRR
jgi:hypothetical protein